MISETKIRGDWDQFKGKVKKKWGKLTDDDLLKSEGKADMIVGKLREKYGLSQEDALNKWENFLDRFDEAGNEIHNSINNVFDMAETAIDCAMSAAKDYRQAAQKKPLLTLSLTALTGFLVGALICRR